MKIRITEIHPLDAYAKAAGIIGLEGELVGRAVKSSVIEDGWKFLVMNTGELNYTFLAVKYEQVQ